MPLHSEQLARYKVSLNTEFVVLVGSNDFVVYFPSSAYEVVNVISVTSADNQSQHAYNDVTVIASVSAQLYVRAQPVDATQHRTLTDNQTLELEFPNVLEGGDVLSVITAYNSNNDLATSICFCILPLGLVSQ